MLQVINYYSYFDAYSLGIPDTNTKRMGFSDNALLQSTLQREQSIFQRFHAENLWKSELKAQLFLSTCVHITASERRCPNVYVELDSG